MSMRRSALGAFGLILFGAALLHGQQNDPFTEWDRQNSKSHTKRSTAREPKTSVTYFSPQTVSESKTADSTKVEARIPMREATTARKTDSISSAAASSTRNTAASAALPGTKRGRVQRAALAKNIDTLKSKKIIQISQDNSVQDDSSTNEDNPFADFLNDGAPSSEVRKEAAAFEVPLEDSPVDEVAETLVVPRKELSKSTSSPQKPKTPVTVAPVSVTKPTVTGTQHVKSEDQGPQSPGVTVQWIRKGDFNVGQECDVELVVQNTSKAIVRSVMTEAMIPADVEVLASIPSPIEGSESPTWTFGELKPGETRTIAMKMVPRQRGDIRLEALVRLTGFSTSEFSVQEPMLSVAVTGPETVEVGEQVSYVVRVSNPGTGIASNVVIQAAIPEGLEHRSGSILSIDIGTLNAGESRQARLSVTAVKGGPQEMAVRVIAAGDLTDETVANVTVAEPQLKIAIVGPTDQMTGRTSDYRMSVSNSGNVPSANVRAKYRIPEGFDYVSANRGGKYNKADHSIEWFVGTLQPDDTSDFQLTLRATVPGELLHQAGVISEHGQVTMCDYSTTVEGMAALDLKISSSDKDLTKGDEVTWEIRIKNTGSRAAKNIGMSCELPSGIQLVDADGPSQHIAENGVMVFRSLPSMEPDSEVVYSIKAHCVREGNHRLRMRVTSESIAEPLIGEESATVVER